MNSNSKTLFTLTGLVILMLGLAYASVPLYKLFCEVTGFGGTPQQVVNTIVEPGEKTLTIRFNADTDPALPWQFYPNQKKIEVRTGTDFTVDYTAVNDARNANTGVAMFNVVPLKAGKYFKKIGCFCFDEQTLQSDEKALMPVNFFIDPEIEKDPGMQDIDTVTLSYTFFPAKE